MTHLMTQHLKTLLHIPLSIHLSHMDFSFLAFLGCPKFSTLYNKEILNELIIKCPSIKIGNWQLHNILIACLHFALLCIITIFNSKLTFLFYNCSYILKFCAFVLLLYQHPKNAYRLKLASTL